MSLKCLPTSVCATFQMMTTVVTKMAFRANIFVIKNLSKNELLINNYHVWETMQLSGQHVQALQTSKLKNFYSVNCMLFTCSELSLIPPVSFLSPPSSVLPQYSQSLPFTFRYGFLLYIGWFTYTHTTNMLIWWRILDLRKKISIREWTGLSILESKGSGVPSCDNNILATSLDWFKMLQNNILANISDLMTTASDNDDLISGLNFMIFVAYITFNHKSIADTFILYKNFIRYYNFKCEWREWPLPRCTSCEASYLSEGTKVSTL